MGFRTCHRLNQYTGYYKYIEMTRQYVQYVQEKTVQSRARAHTNS